MGITLDGNTVFDRDGLSLKVGNVSRACVERSAAGLDGVLSIDMGARGRRLLQSGTLRAVSGAAMDRRIASVDSFRDGASHTLVADGETFEDLRMDSFEVTHRRSIGAGVVVDYEIVYTQLKV